MKAYRLFPHYGLPEEIGEYLYDIDEDFRDKRAYLQRATKLTDLVNKKFNTNYKLVDLFPLPYDIGWRYCPKCNKYYWEDDGCDCD